jgi:hypothetical protein
MSLLDELALTKQYLNHYLAKLYRNSYSPELLNVIAKVDSGPLPVRLTLMRAQ